MSIVSTLQVVAKLKILATSSGVANFTSKQRTSQIDFQFGSVSLTQLVSTFKSHVFNFQSAFHFNLSNFKFNCKLDSDLPIRHPVLVLVPLSSIGRNLISLELFAIQISNLIRWTNAMHLFKELKALINRFPSSNF